MTNRKVVTHARCCALDVEFKKERWGMGSVVILMVVQGKTSSRLDELHNREDGSTQTSGHINRNGEKKRGEC